MTARSKRARKSIKSGVRGTAQNRLKTHGKDGIDLPRHGFDYDDIDKDVRECARMIPGYLTIL